jgi:cyclase
VLTRRIIPCLDIRGNRVVKGVQFADLRDAGDPLERAARYVQAGADEICFLDVTASLEERPLLLDLLVRLSRVLFVPFSVGGGVRRVTDAHDLLRAGADKIGVNTAAVQRPDLLGELALAFGVQCVVLSIDARRVGDDWRVTTHGGRELTERRALDWAQEAVERGAGEILLNCIDTDGVRNGFELELTDRVAQAVHVPVIASGGAGSPQHFVDLFKQTAAQAALAASIFHDGTTTPHEIKCALHDAGVEVRL